MSDTNSEPVIYLVNSQDNDLYRIKQDVLKYSDTVSYRYANTKITGLKELLFILFRYKSRVVITFATFIILGFITCIVLPSIYKSESTLMVKFGREYIYQPEVGKENHHTAISYQSYIQHAVNDEIQVLTSRDVIYKVINDLGVDNLFMGILPKLKNKKVNLESSIDAFKKNLTIKAIKNSTVIKISFQNPSPLLASQAVNLLIDYAKEKHLQVLNTSKSVFLKEQVQSYRMKLQESEIILDEFRNKHKVFSLKEQKTLLLDQENKLDNKFKSTSSTILELEQKIISLNHQKSSIKQDIPLYTETGAERYKIIDDAKSELLNLKLKKQGLLEKYNPKNRLIKNIEKEISLVSNFILIQEKNLQKIVRTGNNSVYQNIELEMIKTKGELNATLAKNRAIKKQLASISEQIKNLSSIENELQNILRTRSINESNYKNYYNKWEESKIIEGMDNQKISNISVIQSAKIPDRPIKPNRILIFSFFFISGIATALLTAVLSNYYSSSISTPAEAEEKLGLKVLTTVPYYRKHFI